MKVSILIPCHNEEKLIKYCVQSCLYQSRPADQIVVVNDGSTDKSLKTLEKFKGKITIVNIQKATGSKSLAQEKGLKVIKGDILITTDGDTILDRDFIKNIVEEFKEKKVDACAGYVKSVPDNWLTASRQIEYLIGQEIHKQAQAYTNSLFVIPGCAAAFRIKVLKKTLEFDHDTLAEDLDITYKCHEKNIKIAYCKKAVVYTQDPNNLNDYVKQLRRWHGGNWQNLLKHIKVLEKSENALELSLIYCEGLIFPLILLISLVVNFKVFLLFYFINLVLTLGFAIFGAIRDKRFDLLWVTPLHMLITFINYGVFMEQFIQEVLLKRNNLVWFQPERKALA